MDRSIHQNVQASKASGKHPTSAYQSLFGPKEGYDTRYHLDDDGNDVLNQNRWPMTRSENDEHLAKARRTTEPNFTEPEPKPIAADLPSFEPANIRRVPEFVNAGLRRDVFGRMHYTVLLLDEPFLIKHAHAGMCSKMPLWDNVVHWAERMLSRLAPGLGYESGATIYWKKDLHGAKYAYTLQTLGYSGDDFAYEAKMAMDRIAALVMYLDGLPANNPAGRYARPLERAQDYLDELIAEINRLVAKAVVARPGALGNERKRGVHEGKKTVRYHSA